MTQTVPATKAAAELEPGDWIDLASLGEDFEGSALVSFTDPYVEYGTLRRVLLVVKAIGDEEPTTMRPTADRQVRVLTENDQAQARRQADRAKFIAGLHEFADWLAANPWAPVQRDSGYFQHARLQVDLHGDDMAATAETITWVREIGARLGVKVEDHLDDRTDASIEIGAVSYSVIAWHRQGRPAEPEPEVPTLPEGLDYSRADGVADDPTPVSPARATAHTGAVVDGDELVVETASTPNGWHQRGCAGATGQPCTCEATCAGGC